MTDEGLEKEIELMFSSAWQDGVNHERPNYLRRDRFFTDRTMQLIKARDAAVRIDELEMVANNTSIENRAAFISNRLTELRRESDHEHKWVFDGDDPYILCECGERRDSITGAVIEKGHNRTSDLVRAKKPTPEGIFRPSREEGFDE